MPDRSSIARAAADRLAGAPPARPRSALVGFDGFIDSISRAVDFRRSMAVPDYVPIRTIPAFAARCAAAAGKSANIERVTLEDRFGGNGPLMAGALARLGVATTFIGAVGEGEIHPVFMPFAERCARCIPIGEPSHTLCMEFDDGKLMFNDTARVQAVTWERVVAAVGLEQLRAIVGESSLLGIVNWSLLGGIEGIWEALRAQVLPGLPGERRVFIDLSDPAKRLDPDIARALGVLARLEETPGVSVTLGLNLSEAQRIAAVTGVGPIGGADARPAAAEIQDAARRIRAAVGLDTVVIHPREGAAAATASDSAWFLGPFTHTPALSTGAGDHFNAGFAFAQIHGLPLPECLAVGCAVSGAYVRDAKSPDLPRLDRFLRELPGPDQA